MKKHSQEQRRRLLQALKASGKTQREFALANGLSIHTLQHWLHYRPKRPQPGFVEVQAPAPTAAAIRLQIGTNLELTLSEMPPPDYIAQLAQALRTSC